MGVFSRHCLWLVTFTLLASVINGSIPSLKNEDESSGANVDEHINPSKQNLIPNTNKDYINEEIIKNTKIVVKSRSDSAPLSDEIRPAPQKPSHAIDAATEEAISAQDLGDGAEDLRASNARREGGGSTRPTRRRRAVWQEESRPEGDKRFQRAAISSRHTTENHLNPRPRNNRNKDSKRCKVRVTEVQALVRTAISTTVADALREELQPLHTALRIVRLDTFSEGIVRQLGTLEHIQSKLLTEQGEMRETVTQASRAVQLLAQQVASLDAKIETLSRAVLSTSSGGGDPSPLHSSPPSRAEELKAVLMQASAAFSSSLRATERRVKDDLESMEKGMTEAIKRSQMAFDTRLNSLTSDTNRILNRTCTDAEEDNSSPTPSFISSNKLFSLADASMPASKYPFGGASSVPSFSAGSLRHFQSNNRPVDARYRQDTTWPGTLPQTNTDDLQQTSTRRRQEPVTPASVTRLASEIAQHIVAQYKNVFPRDCSDITAGGSSASGVYTVYPSPCSNKISLKVWCDLRTDGGAWTVIQRRGSRDRPRDEFFRDWLEYKWGFGDLETDHWIGNEYIHQLTSAGDYELRVDVTDWSDEGRWAVYRHFHLGGDDASNYTLHIGDYRGNAGNSLKYHHGASFSTKDRDNDNNPLSHCARTFHGAWWFTACHEAHLNGRYHRSPHRAYGEGINWMTFNGLNYSHKSSRMMIRLLHSAPSSTNARPSGGLSPSGVGNLASQLTVVPTQ